MEIQKEGCPLPVSDRFVKVLEKAIEEAGVTPTAGVCINFRNTHYSPEYGGFHPVEISVDANGRLRYITDFAYDGRPPMAELAKEVDFDFTQGCFEHFGAPHPIEEGAHLYHIWQSNFCDYWEAGVYDETVVREEL